MPHCPRCHQLVTAEAISCPHCKAPLKAFGHPGIPLHQATKETFLCDSCTYHEDDTCTFPQRPYAKTCTLYQDRNQPLTPELTPSYYGSGFKAWCRRNRALLFLLSLVAVSVLLVLTSS